MTSIPTLNFFGVDLIGLGLIIVAYVSLFLALSLSLNLELGFTGIPNFGKALFVAAGASFGGSFSGLFATLYLKVGIGSFVTNNTAVAGQVNALLAHNIVFDIILLLASLVVAGAVGAIFGLVVSVIAVRLKEVYLAMTFFAFAQFFQIFAQNYVPLAGGNLGIQVADPYAWAGENRFLVATGVLAIFAVLTFIYFQRTTRSPLGRTLRALRDNHDPAMAYGKNIVLMRMKVVVIASVISAIVGALYGFYSADVIGGSFDNTLWTFYPWLIVVMGGAANNFGIVAGSVVFWSLLEFTDIIKFSFTNVIPFQILWLQYILNGVILLLILKLRPGGLLKERDSVPLKDSDLREVARRLGKPETIATEEKDDKT